MQEKESKSNGWFIISVLFTSLCRVLLTRISSFFQDIRSFFSPKGKTAKPGALKVEDKRGKDTSAKSASKQEPGKGRVKSRVRKYFFSFTKECSKLS